MGRDAREVIIEYTKAYSVVERYAKYFTLVNSSRVGERRFSGRSVIWAEI